ncbi:HlyD family secretion protein [Mizugakiibacter sediminis]|uniref:Hemolysin D n=1 Tax=Mizugakiibacter sediminis TaxID=1475481 RepID=A0A0K8QM87_9GAMM|nr:efflux RND transporter periplasmic adaptor subunit [Mizugakiibacter sediminis]GAP65547.1 HlyD family secretion protein [Mizugakiibacter sediminis]
MTTENYAKDAAAAAAPQNGRRRFLMRLLFAVIAVAAIGSGLWYLFVGRWNETTDDAYVQGNVVQITPQIYGTVVSIGADDGDLVTKGQVLVKLDPSDVRVALEQAKANLARTVRQVRGLYSNVSGLEADVAAKQVALDKARADYARREGLAKSGAISAEELAHARDALAAAQSALAAAQQQLGAGRALVDDTVIASHPEVQAAAAALRKAYLDSVRTTLVAPVTGYVAKRTVQVGQRVQPGAALMAVVPLNQVWVDANFKETQLEHMRIGQPVTLTSDLYGSGVEFHGKVESLGIGTGSAFALLPAQNATGNWIKIVQRVPVRIALDPRELEKHPLRIGLSMDVDVNLHDRNGPLLAQQPPRQPAFSTDVYDGHEGEADALIRSIVHANASASAGRHFAQRD